MGRSTQRLRRYLDDELDECLDDDVEERLEELTAFAAGPDAGTLDAELGVLTALANDTRYTLVRVLVAADEELCACELNAVVEVTESGLSHALSRLEDAGLVTGRKEGRWKKYRTTNRAVAIVTVLEGTVSDGSDA